MIVIQDFNGLKMDKPVLELLLHVQQIQHYLPKDNVYAMRAINLLPIVKPVYLQSYALRMLLLAQMVNVSAIMDIIYKVIFVK